MYVYISQKNYVNNKGRCQSGGGDKNRPNHFDLCCPQEILIYGNLNIYLVSIDLPNFELPSHPQQYNLATVSYITIIKKNLLIYEFFLFVLSNLGMLQVSEILVWINLLVKNCMDNRN